jgi:hypothetical protein
MEKGAQFLAAPDLTPRDRVHHISAHRRNLCDDLSEDVTDLVSAIGIPD